MRYSQGWRDNLWGGGQYESFGDYFADYMSISDAGYATELEVKISRADWRVDLEKPKWKVGLPSYVSRFIYVVPRELIARGIPEWVSPVAGIWSVVPENQHSHAYVEVVRAPKRVGKEKVPDAVLSRWLESMYYRYWRMRQEDQRGYHRRQLDQAEKRLEQYEARFGPLPQPATTEPERDLDEA